MNKLTNVFQKYSTWKLWSKSFDLVGTYIKSDVENIRSAGAEEHFKLVLKRIKSFSINGYAVWKIKIGKHLAFTIRLCCY